MTHFFQLPLTFLSGKKRAMMMILTPATGRLIQTGKGGKVSSRCAGEGGQGRPTRPAPRQLLNHHTSENRPDTVSNHDRNLCFCHFEVSENRGNRRNRLRTGDALVLATVLKRDNVGDDLRIASNQYRQIGENGER
jgi:hypothetical protein